jgi:hypothetical protein
MHDVSATCPLCKSAASYGAELIGRYTLCPACRGRFYIEVPRLDEAEQPLKLRVEAATVPDVAQATTLDDLLLDTQQGNRFVIQSLWRLESKIRWHGYGLMVVLALSIAILALMIRAA